MGLSEGISMKPNHLNIGNHNLDKQGYTFNMSPIDLLIQNL